ncbi:spermidine synthase [Salinispora tropica]|uniref:Spermidine synthase-like protein n=1 Tax=Salinispora tropica (strain ATCC BAA-916 / DSM 44818 / JCM 13857 / NBRC 105044 / CNB-440) TaxID=369723 RepID=A4X236_SALTO|nr:spermidine synthase [Salinispora tropica]ABP52936.1 Spermidine synthase-like protein [Salinispora tropica CNB-440]
MHDFRQPPITLDRVTTSRGELVLRETNGRYEVISNGVFLMDTADGRSERLLVDAAVSRCTGPAPRLLIGGLGVGFSLLRAVEHPHVAAIDVVEIEATVIGWHARHLRPLTGAAQADPRVRIVEADILAWLADTADQYDAICLDTDNGPNWLVFEANAELYAHRGLDLVAGRLRPGGVLAIWSASRDDAFEQRLRERFGDLELLETPTDAGAPDVVYLVRAATAAPGELPESPA